MAQRPSWNDIFMQMAYIIASRSPDPRTHVGCVIVDNQNSPVSMGYNGLPRGMAHPPKDDPIWQSPLKYKWMEHAERNAIFNAAAHGKNLSGCKLYVTLAPCMDCARALVQVGIKEVVVCGRMHEKYVETAGVNRWEEDFAQLNRLARETGTKFDFYYCSDESPRILLLNGVEVVV
jgi:dCMP deaminase